MRPVAGQWKSSRNMDTYSNKAGKQEVVGGAKGKVKGRRGKGIIGEGGGKWRGGKKRGEGRKDKSNRESWRKGQDSICPSLELPL